MGCIFHHGGTWDLTPSTESLGVQEHDGVQNDSDDEKNDSNDQCDYIQLLSQPGVRISSCRVTNKISGVGLK